MQCSKWSHLKQEFFWPPFQVNFSIAHFMKKCCCLKSAPCSVNYQDRIYHLLPHSHTPCSLYVLLTVHILSSALPHPHLPIGWPVEEPTCRQGLSPFCLLSSHYEQGSIVPSHCLPISISFPCFFKLYI